MQSNTGKWDALFDQLDTDHDGWLTHEEFIALRRCYPVEDDYFKLKNFFIKVDELYGDSNRLFDRREFEIAMDLIE